MALFDPQPCVVGGPCLYQEIGMSIATGSASRDTVTSLSTPIGATPNILRSGILHRSSLSCCLSFTVHGYINEMNDMSKLV